MGRIDGIVVRAALIDARKYLASGAPPAAAAKLASVGAWAPYRGLVEERLRAEQHEAWQRYYDENKAA